MKVYVKKTESKVGEEKLLKWTKQGRLKTYWRMFRKWASEKQFMLWTGAFITVSFVAVFLGYLIARSVL